MKLLEWVQASPQVANTNEAYNAAQAFQWQRQIVWYAGENASETDFIRRWAMWSVWTPEAETAWTLRKCCQLPSRCSQIPKIRVHTGRSRREVNRSAGAPQQGQWAKRAEEGAPMLSWWQKPFPPRTKACSEICFRNDSTIYGVTKYLSSRTP